VIHFAGFSFLTVFLLVLAYWLIGRFSIADFQASKWNVLLLCGVLALKFVLGALLVYPISGLILPLGLAISLWALRRNRLIASEPDALSTLTGKPRWRNSLALALAPITASITYALYVGVGLQIPANWPIYVITTFGGFTLFGWSVYRLLRSKPISETPDLIILVMEQPHP
jgi:hypothetical protein